MSSFYTPNAHPTEVLQDIKEEPQYQADIRPEGMSTRQDDIIQRVAEFVVNSCDGAKYQYKLRRRTNFNSYFGFLDVEHPYHAYYEYLIKSYQYWKNVQDVLSTNAEQDQQAYAYYQEQLLQEQQQQGYANYSENNRPDSYTGVKDFPYVIFPRSSAVIPTKTEEKHKTKAYSLEHDGPEEMQHYHSSHLEHPYDATSVLSVVDTATEHPNSTIKEMEEYELVFENGVERVVAKKMG